MKVGLIGCGLVGRKRAFQLGDKHDLVAVCDNNTNKAADLAHDHPHKPVIGLIKTVLRLSDVVIVSTTHDALADTAKRAIQAGKHVLIEKPVCKDSIELQDLIAAADSADVKVRVGFNHRYHPAVLKAKKLVDDYSIGELLHLRARYGHGGREGYDREWRADPAIAAGGELVEQGIHIIDLARWFLGSFTEVHGFAATEFWDQKLDDNAYLTLMTADKKTVQMHVSCTEWKNTFSLELFGTLGKVEVNGLGGSYGIEKCILYTRPFVNGKRSFGYPDTTVWEYPGPDESWKAEFDDFDKDVMWDRQPSASLSNAMEAWQVINKIYRNSKGMQL